MEYRSYEELSNMPCPIDWATTSNVCDICNQEEGVHFDGWCGYLDEKGKLQSHHGFKLQGYHGLRPTKEEVIGRFSFAVLKDSSVSCNSKCSKPINDFVCPHCKNNRVSKCEKSCWLCGLHF